MSALAAAAAIRAGIPFTTRLTAHDGLLSLPTLGALRTASATSTTVGIAFHDGELTLREDDSGPPLLAHTQPDGTTGSADPRWLPVLALPAVPSGTGPVPLDDVDPYRTDGGGHQPHGLSAAPTSTTTNARRGPSPGTAWCHCSASAANTASPKWRSCCAA